MPLQDPVQTSGTMMTSFNLLSKKFPVILFLRRILNSPVIQRELPVTGRSDGWSGNQLRLTL
jgi:hypothetical protein